MMKFGCITKETLKEHNPNWPQIPDHPYRILIIGGSGSGKTNSLFNLISQQPDIDKIYLNGKDLFETKYQFLINKRESTGLKHFNDSKLFIEYSNNMYDIYKNIEQYMPNKKRKILIAFDDMIADMLSNKMKHLLSNEAKEQKDVLLGMFLGTLGILINLLSGKGVMRTDEGTIRASEGTIRDFNAVRIFNTA